MAKAFSRVGQIQSLLGEKKLAEQAFRQSLALFDEFLSAHPLDPAHQRPYLDALLKLADLLSSIKETVHVQEAERLYPMFGVKPAGSSATARENALFSRL
jgi:hypothetical protein